MPPIDYTKKATESLDQYNTRISGTRGYSVQANPAGVSTTTDLKTGVITPASMAPSPTGPLTPVTAPTTPTPAMAPLPSAPTPATPADVPLQQETDIYKMMKDLQGETNNLGSEQAFTTQQEEAQKVQEKQGLVNSLLNQNNALTQQAEGVKLQLQQTLEAQKEAARGQGVTAGGLAPQLRGSQVQANQQLLSLAIQQHQVAAQHAVASGDLATALSLVDRAVRMQYQPQKDALDAKRANIELLLKDPTLTLAQEKRAIELKRKYEAEDRQIEADAKTKTELEDAKLKAISLNVGNPKLDNMAQGAINAAQTPQEVLQVMQVLGLSTLSEADRLSQTNADRAFRQSQYQFDQSQANADRAYAESVRQWDAEHTPPTSDAPVIVNVNGVDKAVTPDALFYARQLASKGVAPSVAELQKLNITASQLEEIAKTFPQPDGALIDRNTGLKTANLSPAQEASVIAMNEIVTKTMPALQDRFGKINTGLLGGVGGMIWTSQDRQDYDTFRQEFLSKLLVARSGAAVTEQEYARYAKMLPSNFNQLFFLGSDGGKKLNSLAQSMQTNLDNMTDTQQLSIVGYTDTKKQLDQLSPEQMAELTKSGATIPVWYKPKAK